MPHLDEGTLQAWLDRDRSGLSGTGHAEIERHLAACAACARRLEEMDALSVRAEGLLVVPPSTDDAIPAYREVVARADRHRAAGRRRSAWIVGGWAASVAVALGVGWMANDLYRADRVAGSAEGAVADEAEAPAAAERPAAPARVAGHGDEAAGLASGSPEILLAPGGDERAWRTLTRTDAEARGGFRLLTVPELSVIRIQVEENSGVTLVRVVQALPQGGVLDLVEARGALRFDAAPPADGRSRVSTRRGGVTVAAAAPLAPEALKALLERLR
jgi:hypothetical protein